MVITIKKQNFIYMVNQYVSFMLQIIYDYIILKCTIDLEKKIIIIISLAIID